MATAKTSETDPIRVDFLPVDAVPLTGRIGITFAPGKVHHGASARWNRSLAADLERLRGVYLASVLVSLLGDEELASLGIAALPAEAGGLGLDVVRFPIVDASVPASVEDVVSLVDRILAVAGQGGNVVIHCRGGLGRAGLVAACCLVRLGHDAAHAIRIVRKVRRHAVETVEQEGFVASVERATAAR